MARSRMGLHTKEERDRAFEFAQEEFDGAMGLRRESLWIIYTLGYLDAISDIALSQGEMEFAMTIHMMMENLAKEKNITEEDMLKW